MFYFSILGVTCPPELYLDLFSQKYLSILLTVEILLKINILKHSTVAIHSFSYSASVGIVGGIKELRATVQVRGLAS